MAHQIKLKYQSPYQILIPLPQDMIWLEALFKRLPFQYDNLRSQVLARILFLAGIWLSGLVIYSVEGLSTQYISNFGLFFGIFASSLLPLYGTYMVQKALPSAINDVEPLLDMGESEFTELSKRITGYAYSFKPVAVIGLILMALISNARVLISDLSVGISLKLIWDILLEFFFFLLSGTGIWLGLSIWLSVLIISRQPFNHLYTDVGTKFRGLAMLILWFTAFYFIAISLGVATSLLGSSAVSLLDLLFSPFSLFLILGFLWVLFPFISIHQTLSQIKQANLDEINKEYQALISRLDEKSSSDESITVIKELLSLQVRERMVSNMEEWPINIGFVTKLLTLVLIPAIVRVSVELFNRYLL